jgi:hypothetical protein
VRGGEEKRDRGIRGKTSKRKGPRKDHPRRSRNKPEDEGKDPEDERTVPEDAREVDAGEPGGSSRGDDPKGG